MNDEGFWLIASVFSAGDLVGEHFQILAAYSKETRLLYAFRCIDVRSQLALSG